MTSITEINRLIEEYATIAGDAGFSAGIKAASEAWRPLRDAPKDGTAIILAVGIVRCVGSWSMHKGCWIQHGTNRMVLPQWWMVLPPIPTERP